MLIRFLHPHIIHQALLPNAFCVTCGKTTEDLLDMFNKYHRKFYTHTEDDGDITIYELA